MGVFAPRTMPSQSCQQSVLCLSSLRRTLLGPWKAGSLMECYGTWPAWARSGLWARRVATAASVSSRRQP
eukprot:scaffold1457_cov350-Prasinococcus_capsulatus_cf.AAC.14